MMKTRHFFLSLMALLVLTGCATAEERAARQAENVKMVKESVGSQHYRININRISTKWAREAMVSGRFIKVMGDQVEVDLPYAGRDDIPHLKTKAELRFDSNIRFKAAHKGYVLSLLPKEKSGRIRFAVEANSETYKFTIDISNTGSARVRVEPERSDYCDYEGDVQRLAQ